ncbi:MAG: hypothetical protein ACRDRX_12835 [Pseudonocardiaceae bacterium]
MSTTEPSGSADNAAERNERPVGVSHLLAADDALSPGRWGAHITLCGAELRPPSATAMAQDEDSEWSPEGVRYCPECVQEARRWVSDASPAGAEGGHPLWCSPGVRSLPHGAGERDPELSLKAPAPG